MLLANTPVDPRRKDAGCDGTPRHAELLIDHAITVDLFLACWGQEKPAKLSNGTACFKTKLELGGMRQALIRCSCLALISTVAAKLASFKLPDDLMRRCHTDGPEITSRIGSKSGPSQKVILKGPVKKEIHIVLTYFFKASTFLG